MVHKVPDGIPDALFPGAVGPSSPIAHLTTWDCETLTCSQSAWELVAGEAQLGHQGQDNIPPRRAWS